jgi:hypothetical protein
MIPLISDPLLEGIIAGEKIQISKQELLEKEKNKNHSLIKKK